MQGYFALNKIDQPISENKTTIFKNDKNVFFFILQKLSFYGNFEIDKWTVICFKSSRLNRKAFVLSNDPIHIFNEQSSLLDLQ